MTNSEKLRAMTDEEIAEAVCEMITECPECAGYELCMSGDDKADGLIKWLKSEAVDE